MEEDTLAVADTAAAAIGTVKDAGMSALEETRSIFHIDEIRRWLTLEHGIKIGMNVAVIVLFYVIYRVIKHLIRKSAARKLRPAVVAVITKAVSYTFYVLIVMYVLGLFGIRLGAIWGAAGIAGVALGFAAQTSVSNLISGVFVITEKALKLGDFIEIDGVSGTVDAISFLSVKVHTLDNQLIRIPNSTIINNKLKNYSTFDLRRLVFELSVDYASDLDKTLAVLATVPAMCPTVLVDKEGYEPKVMLVGLGASGISVNVNVWFERANLVQTRTDLCRNIVKACREAGINIPFNRMDVTVLNDATTPRATRLAPAAQASAIATDVLAAGGVPAGNSAAHGLKIV